MDIAGRSWGKYDMNNSKISLAISSVCALTLMVSFLTPAEAQRGSGTAIVRTRVLPQYLRLENVKHGDTVSRLAVVSDAQISSNMRKIIDIADRVSRHENVATLVLANGKGIIYQKYKYGTSPNTHLIGYSMTKGITSMAVGKALCSGHIKNINDKAEKYVSELAGSAYGATSIKNLLTMSSGVLNNFNKYREIDMRLLAYKKYSAEDLKYMSKRYSGIKKFLLASDKRLSIASYLSSFKSRKVRAGKRYLYSGQDTDALGLVVSRSTSMSLIEYTSKEIWQKIGAESDAKWMVDKDGDAIARAGFYAQSHDWIRLGQYILTSLQSGSEDKCFQNYMIKATSSQKPRGNKKYGYQFFTEIRQLKHKTIQLVGLGGQRLIMEPVTGTIVYMFSGGRRDKWMDKSGFYRLVKKFIELSPKDKQ